jgi:hypothetical protein
VTLIKKAHQIDSSNEEVATQCRELEYKLSEKSVEDKIKLLSLSNDNVLQGNVIGESKSSTSTTTSSSISNQLTMINDIINTLRNEDIQYGTLTDKNATKYLKYLNSIIDIFRSDSDEATYRVYFRTCGGLLAVIEYFNIMFNILYTNDLTSNSNNNDSDHQSSLSNSVIYDKHIEIFEKIIHIMASGTRLQRSSKMLIHEHTIVNKIYAILRKGLSSKHVTEGIIGACFHMLMESMDDMCSKLRSDVFKNIELITDIATVLYEVHTKDMVNETIESTIIAACTLIKDITQSTEGKKIIGVNCSQAVRIMGTILGDLVVKKSKKYLLQINALLECLLVLSQLVPLRLSYSYPLVTTSKDNNNSSTIKTILTTISKYNNVSDEICSMCLATLMNITVQDSNISDNDMRIIRFNIFNEKGFDICMSIIQRDNRDIECSVISRAIGLLTRLTTVPDVQNELRKCDIYESLCKRFQASASSNSSTSWITEERSHLVRLIASIENPSAECRNAALKYDFVPSLLSLFPMPRQELGQITPTSVVLPPFVSASPILLGNAARCLIGVADIQQHANILFTEKKYYGVEKLINAMASCSDMRVRKNIAIILAKGCRIPEVRERVEYYRGMQIIVELQKSLL